MILTAPTLETTRLRLRPLTANDYAAYAAVMQSERGVHMGGPPDDTAKVLDPSDIAYRYSR